MIILLPAGALFKPVGLLHEYGKKVEQMSLFKHTRFPKQLSKKENHFQA